MSIKCELVELIERPSLSIRVRTASQYLPQILEKGFAEIREYLKEFGQQAAGRPYAKYYNLDTRDLDVEFGLPVNQYFSGRDNIQATVTPKGKAVTCLHIGPLTEVELSYHTLAEWLMDNGYVASGLAYEVYLNELFTTSPEKLQTQIYEMIKTHE